MNRPQPIKPKAGEESVWDYPRPPRLEKVTKHLEVFFNGELIASSKNAYRVLETSHPPNYYFPPTDLMMEYFTLSAHKTFCEWKGKGSYYDIEVKGKKALNACWFYDAPTQSFLPIKNYAAFYANKMDRCLVDGELVSPQPGEFYGGWVTQNIVGPFKGIPGSWGW